MQYLPILQLLILVTLANGAPIIAKQILANHFAWPLDGNLNFIDGRPLFGPSKTIRGVLVAVLVTTASAPLLGLEFRIGLLVGTVCAIQCGACREDCRRGVRQMLREMA
jgi:CDP-2,3-bis-(O-geranylgeranyl)-sn-glycerol synthase